MRTERVIGGAALLSLVMSCGGSGGGNPTPPPQPPPFTSVKQVRVSQPPTFGACNGVAQPGTLYDNAAVEPSLVINPANSANLVAAWQQSRWDNGGSQAVNLGVSFDGGMTWQVRTAAFSVCTGGNVNNAGNYLRASDPWVTASTTGNLIYALSLSFTGGAFAAASSNGQLVARSIDGGNTWGATIALIKDGAGFFNDKGSITADPTSTSYVYAVWDRESSATNGGPSYFARTIDGGNSWQGATSIWDPGPNNQTIGNIIVVIPGDILVDVFTELDTAAGGKVTAELRAIRSIDRGMSWSQPVTIAENQAVGAFDPLTKDPIRDSSNLFSVSTSVSGAIYVVWQDARFSMGAHDGIALSSSTDGGTTWSTPVQVNADTNAVAFTPTINVRADGVIAITYYDLRNDTFAGMVLTDCWMVTSGDGKTFSESHLSGPFDLNNAALSQVDGNGALGLFLGDYQALTSTSTQFLPLFVQTNPGMAVSSDAFINFPPATAAAAAAPAARVFEARAADPRATLDAGARQRVMDRIRATRRAHWSQGR